jgi:hypothetical protein
LVELEVGPVKWKLAVAVVAIVAVSASVAAAVVTNRTAVVGTTVDQVRVTRGDDASVVYPINDPTSTAWVNVPEMLVGVRVPSGQRLLLVSLSTEDVPHADGGGFTVEYRLVVDGEPLRTEPLPQEPVLGSFDSVGPLGPGVHVVQMQVAVPEYFCTTPSSCDPLPGESLPLTVSFDKPWEIGVQRVVVPS